jgi:uncharacterized membrane protein
VPAHDLAVSPLQEAPTHARLTAAVVLGVGLGGFADGILLHQLAQWHNMGSAIVRPVTMEAMSRNMAWDGWFHLATWFITLVGVLMLWREGRDGRRGGTLTDLVGQMLFGWGAFNVLEGVANHHLLGLHHVRDMPEHVPIYDWLFLLIGGLGFLAIGALMHSVTSAAARRSGTTA